MSLTDELKIQAIQNWARTQLKQTSNIDEEVFYGDILSLCEGTLEPLSVKELQEEVKELKAQLDEVERVLQQVHDLVLDY